MNINRFTVSGEITDSSGTVCDINGDWTDNLSFNGEQYWKIGEVRPQLHLPVKTNVLPSDVRYHESMIWLSRGE